MNGEYGITIGDSLPVRAERLDEAVLDELVVPRADIELSAALRLAEMDTVGDTIAGVAETWSFAERLRRTGRYAVYRHHISGQSPLAENQCSRGHVAHERQARQG